MIEIKNEVTVYDGFFKLVEAEIEQERFDGNRQTIKRLKFERGDSVAAIVFDQSTWELVFVEQFRYPAYSRSGEETIIELVAGMLEPGEDKDNCLEREIREELGYEIARKVYLGCYFISPPAAHLSEYICTTWLLVQETVPAAERLMRMKT